MTRLTNTERLIRLEDKIDTLSENFKNHLKHHFAYSLAAWGVAVSAIGTMILLLLKQLRN